MPEPVKCNSDDSLLALEASVRRCRICEGRFKATSTSHSPKPVFWCSPKARILVAGQAPGARVHQSGVPFSDPSGDRLRHWMGVSHDEFYDKDRVAILPMAFCFPGYDRNGGDIPPPAICAKTWRDKILQRLDAVETTLLVGGYAQKWHLRSKAPTVTATVRNWEGYAPYAYPLPHPSWRNNAWLKRNPWFETELLPNLRRRIRILMGEN
ncbi:MAG: uracil-DNA glycosylase family protein [Albidovulum sp.]|nr:uracil-DNA glycosylase family protein [Albidovulum sp.]